MVKEKKKTVKKHKEKDNKWMNKNDFKKMPGKIIKFYPWCKTEMILKNKSRKM